ncbi:alpha/beta fold hydrolase [Cellulomonas fimi]|uniref:Prolyl aminopeptidase n=1 Tax=Cellulomonas fimi (strain ATCC 484 / DSM 20113 / JCM 1341 / CCUG 24087 / LMG 16345 / NBRC 15513 / NCIMB 8980 / NCTC 7547 / NRS-133) TaxID=590998 RepID=F4H4K8_CELFA|nr:alpha/beta fold hydrolase [Cellulomonas fimi]AEE47803.1 Prolyl aminopeptidase [Cellulomonas fimi ATCC 484]VEH37034.1 Proline iminopeptidase [Cellulomonas fimi]
MTHEYAMTGFVVRDHRVRVPVDWADPARFGDIEVFAREVVDPRRATQDLPLLLFLQGGPGGMGPRPAPGSWLGAALEKYRVVLLDQRGTGRSSRVDGRVVARFDDPEVAADYLACFRGDAIVADAEHLRTTVFGGRRWATLGQSYGGFLTMTYLSRHPEALTRCYVTGGLPPLTVDAEGVYRETFDRQASRNAELRRQHPDDVELLGALADRVAAGDVLLPDGDVLTPERLQTLGMQLGMSTGITGLHWLLDTALDSTGEPSVPFLADVASRTGFDAMPLYAVLQEVIYHQGERAGGWVAEREAARRPEFSPSARPLLLTGEAMFPWMYAQQAALRPFERVAHVLAERTSWPELYDLDRLASNEVPVAAVMYYDDPYVDLGLALRGAEAVGNVQVWITNEHLHDGVRVAGDTILPRLVDLVDGVWSVTSR